MRLLGCFIVFETDFYDFWGLWGLWGLLKVLN